MINYQNRLHLRGMEVDSFLYKHNVFSWDSVKFKHKLNISFEWKIRKYLPLLTVLLFKNSTNFAEVNTPVINHNALLAKINTYEKKYKFPKLIRKETNYWKNNKFLLKRLQIFYIFRKNVSKWKHWGVKHLCTFFYVDSTVSSIYADWGNPRKTLCLQNAYKFFDMEVRQRIDIVKREYLNVPYQEVDLSRPE